MRIIVVGYGVQGVKRAKVAGDNCKALVDPVHPEAKYKRVEQVPLDLFDAALVCTPDGAKFEILAYLLKNNKHIMVEKPLLSHSSDELDALKSLAENHKVSLYTAYNHRFEPHFQSMYDAISRNELGKIYSVRLFYGNGTARLVRDSEWRDQGGGVIPDLGSHLLDTLLFWLGKPSSSCHLYEANCFENKAPDQCSFGFKGTISVHMEISLLSWRNHFYADVIGEKGSAHIESLCKWGPSSFTLRKRVLPSGRPDESSETLVQSDPTWEAEWDYFKTLCASGLSNIDNDIWINTQLNILMKQAGNLERTKHVTSLEKEVG
jgi:predicted dehydrogenase